MSRRHTADVVIVGAGAAGLACAAEIVRRSARETLAKPLRDTLFFAGEATDLSGEAATVGGALHSGLRAARELIGKR